MATNYIWDFAADSYLEETDDSGVASATYTEEPVQYGRVISQERNGQTCYYHFDGNLNTCQLTGHNQTVIDNYVYAWFGEVSVATTTTLNPFRYCGLVAYFYDVDLGTCYVRERTYQPLCVNWLSADPLGSFLGEVNVYRYSRNSSADLPDASRLLAARSVYAYCGGCGVAAMQWRIETTDQDKVALVVQKICFEVSVIKCIKKRGCCVGGERHFCRLCYYEELLRSPSNWVIDYWALPTLGWFDGPAGCGFRGNGRVSSQIRAFPGKPENYKKKNWENGKGVIQCPQDPKLKIEARNFSLVEPSWWNDHTVEITSSMVARWKCCEGDVGGSYMGYESSNKDDAEVPCRVAQELE